MIGASTCGTVATRIARRTVLPVLASIVLLVPAAARADEFKLDARGEPIRICDAVQRNVRFMYNARANGASSTYAEIRAHIRKELAGRGEAEDRLNQVYERILTRIESDEFSPPKADRAEGQLKARQEAGTDCLRNFER